MKSKKILIVPLVLVSLTVFTFSGCSKPAEKPADTTTDDTKTENVESMPNPVVERTSSEEVSAAIGFTFESLPADITDVKYSTISNNLAQVTFTSNGVNYTARKADPNIDNVSGVYTAFKNGETRTTASGTAVIFQSNDDGMGLATWKTDNFIYSVYCESGFDAAAMEAIVNSIS
ncbi:hypothetical protein [Acetobacterium malicum]|uniref:hypothetical protein n=1 Tax=Acetobacterium malicum TaxID=52692 RepID=UPI0003FB4789|nr:hypothetical protein [Acetobacterium dehalogenans]